MQRNVVRRHSFSIVLSAAQPVLISRPPSPKTHLSYSQQTLQFFSRVSECPAFSESKMRVVLLSVGSFGINFSSHATANFEDRTGSVPICYTTSSGASRTGHGLEVCLQLVNDTLELQPSVNALNDACTARSRLVRPITRRYLL